MSDGMSDIALVERGIVVTPALGGSEVACTGHRTSAVDRHTRFRGPDPERDLDALELDAPSAEDVECWQRSLRASDGVRWGLIDQVRHSIERGSYLTADRLDVTARQLARDLGH